LIRQGVLGREITIGEAVRQAPAAGSDAVGTVLSAIWGFVGGVFGVVTILIVAFYLLIDADNLVRRWCGCSRDRSARVCAMRSGEPARK
jgi:predicted PurR-regulated permease PerM